MNQKQVLFSLVFLLAGVGIGFFAAESIVKKAPKTKSAETVVIQHGTTSGFINPLISCTRERGIEMFELQSFRAKIQEYIDLKKRENSNLDVAFYFRDLNNGMWSGINEREKFSPASLMKVPVMIAVLKEAESNTALLQQRIRFDKKMFANVDEDSGFPKEDGKEYSVDELLVQMIKYSDNAATVILLQLIGEDKVRKVDHALNLDVQDGMGSTTDFVMIKSYAGIFRVLYNASFLNKAMSEKALSLLASSDFSRGIRKTVPANVIMAHKYGERDHFDAKQQRVTDQLHHFGLVYYPSKPYLLGIMTRGAKTKEAALQIIEDLSAMTYNEVDKQVQKYKADQTNKDLQE